MSRISTQQRQHSILEQLQSEGEVGVEALSKRFSTSEVTIRKDLRQLEAARKLVRKFGGAVKVETYNKSDESPIVSKRKYAIAKRSAQLIPSGARIVIDAGTTVSALLPHIEQRKDLVVMTNSLKIANRLTTRDVHPQILFTGGTWDQQSEAFQGKMAEQMLRAYDFDMAFIGAAGLDPERGTTTFNELTNLSQVMADVSRHVVIMAESDKLHRRIPNVELPWKNISTLVTDTAIAAESVRLIQQHGVDVICATDEEH
ncbi:DeoR/GlpR family DNA-binding transcription regulator [Alteromonas oceanisediminis]|uniref:DeoR/GlpR family DNA-binding transcription regulator n=1 Tax=Alteromonas oceanisediminis TaxID=2836180 RepID=UPI001BD92B84|nr:DeoR/GlpR family DNA-binding transcription regulator [Alteromonas oceanisediminis]MBT0586285.1 DeoR/GlpR family DNA-binding transcription regulator [Alteromonas oceanisediminis]